MVWHRHLSTIPQTASERPYIYPRNGMADDTTPDPAWIPVEVVWRAGDIVCTTAKTDSGMLRRLDSETFESDSIRFAARSLAAPRPLVVFSFRLLAGGLSGGGGSHVTISGDSLRSYRARLSGVCGGSLARDTRHVGL